MSDDFYKEKYYKILDDRFSIQVGQAVNLAFDVVLRKQPPLSQEDTVDEAMKLAPDIFREMIKLKKSLRKQETPTQESPVSGKG